MFGEEPCLRTYTVELLHFLTLTRVIASQVYAILNVDCEDRVQ